MTNHDESGRLGLTPQQLVAAEVLASGRTVTDAARAAGVSRQACSAWLNHHPQFRAHLNTLRAELWGLILDRMRDVLPEAINVLEKKLQRDEPDSWRAAVEALKLGGLANTDLGKTGYSRARAYVEERAREKRHAEQLMEAFKQAPDSSITDRQRESALEDLLRQVDEESEGQASSNPMEG